MAKRIKKEDIKKKIIALVDLDGTLADLDFAVIQELCKMMSPAEMKEFMINGRPDRDLPHISARRDSIMRVPGFWDNLGLIPNGVDVLNALKEIGFSPMILSKGPSSKFLAWAEKVKWVREKFPGIPVTLTEDKSLSYGRVLFDDFPPYFLPWLDVRPRGLVICLATEDNDFDSPLYNEYREDLAEYESRIFRYRGREDYDELCVRLKEAYNR